MHILYIFQKWPVGSRYVEVLAAGESTVEITPVGRAPLGYSVYIVFTLIVTIEIYLPKRASEDTDTI